MQMKNKTKKLFSMLLCIVLIVAMALFTTGCAENKETNSTLSSQTQVDVIVKGEGQTAFDFSVVDKDGNVTYFEIHTDKDVVGQALLDCQLIEGEEGPYGLYVKVVNGITADYDADGTYWAFYVNGEYAITGVDDTAINTEDFYSFRVEK